MKTKDVPAIVMLLAGGVYCLIGIRYQIPLIDFTLQLLLVLIIFWILGGIIRIVLDKYMVEMADKPEESEEEKEEEKEESEEKTDKATAASEDNSTSEDDE